MSDIQYPENGKKNINLKSTDLCGNTRNEAREVNIIQRLLEGQYISILEDGDKATISADVSADYYNKAQINELLGDLDTVKFKVVSALPAVGAENVIYLVPKAAPEVGYEQYIWDSNDAVFYPIGDTNIDLSDYYTKAQSDTKYQQKLIRAQDITVLSESTEFSQVDLANNMVHKIAPGAIWNYIKSKMTEGMVYPVQDNTRISGLDLSKPNPNQYFSATDLFSYVMGKIGAEDVTTMTDSTVVSDFVPLASNQVKRITGSAIWTYIWDKVKTIKLSSSVATDKTESDKVPSTKAVYDHVESKKLYRHDMTLRFNDGNRKARISIINNRSTAYTASDLTTYLRGNYADDDANIVGNLYGILPCSIGYYKVDSTSYEVLGVVYSTTKSAVCVVGRRFTGATSAADLVVLNTHGGVYQLMGYIPQALN